MAKLGARSGGQASAAEGETLGPTREQWHSAGTGALVERVCTLDRARNKEPTGELQHTTVARVSRYQADTSIAQPERRSGCPLSPKPPR
jgi:hypothetical protein